jgi:hypothetical protein
MTHLRRGWLWYTGAVLIVLITLVFGTLGGLAIQFQAWPVPLWIAIWSVAILAILVTIFLRGLIAGIVGLLVVFVSFTLWWVTITPTNDRDWQADVAQLPSGTRDPSDPSLVTISNVRNFDWITETEFLPRWDTRTYDLDALESVDLVLTYWAGPAIAHTMLSFGFSDGEHLVFSIGIRPSKGETYSSLAGFFKTYELVVTAADERDVIRLRTSVQDGNRVQLYRIKMPDRMMRGLFEEYVDLSNQLVQEPRFYRTVVANCTTMIWGLVKRLDPSLPSDYRILLPGYLPGLLYDLKTLDLRFTLTELEAIGELSWEAPSTQDGPAYSAALRFGIPAL